VSRPSLIGLGTHERTIASPADKGPVHIRSSVSRICTSPVCLLATCGSRGGQASATTIAIRATSAISM
jgi:hypothetical protein